MTRPTNRNTVVAAAAVALALGWVAGPGGASGGRAVDCALPDGRAYRLANHGTATAPRWVLAWRRPGSPDRSLVLRGAEPRIAAAHAALSYRSANGGIIVALDVGPAAATLDVHVNYELEVNVDVSLVPEIDELNTNGVQRAVCRIG